MGRRQVYRHTPRQLTLLSAELVAGFCSQLTSTEECTYNEKRVNLHKTSLDVQTSAYALKLPEHE